MKKTLKVFTCCAVFMFIALTFSACALFTDPASVTKSGWEKAFAYNNKVIITQTITGGGVTVINLDGNKVRIQGSMAGVSYINYLNYDGTKYWLYNYLDESQEWEKVEIDEQLYNTPICVGVFKYDDFTFNDDVGVYEATNLKISEETTYSSVTITIDRGKIQKIVFVSKGVTSTINYEYGKDVNVTIPNINGGNNNDDDNNNSGDNQGASVISEQDWVNAFNLTDKYIMTQELPLVGTLVVKVDGNKVEMQMGESSSFMYFDGQKYYQYSKLTVGVEQWNQYEIDEEVFKTNIGKNNELKDMYSLFTYNETTQKFEIQQSGSSVKVSFDSNKRLKKIEMVDGVTATLTFNYSSDFTVILPNIDEGNNDNGNDNTGSENQNNGPISEQEWLNAFNLTNKYTMTNVSPYNGTQIVKFDNNKVEMHKDEYVGYMNFDGTNYYLYTCQGSSNLWQKETIDENEFYYYIGKDIYVKDMFSWFEYNSQTGNYEYKIGSVMYAKVVFDNSKRLSYIELIDDGDVETFAFNYSTDFTVTLPNVDDGNNNGENN